MATEWHTFFSVVISTTGSLLGLLFVAISISIDKIIKSKGLPKMALQPLALLLAILICSIYFLIPEQSSCALGVEVSISGCLIWLFMLLNDLSVISGSQKELRKKYLSNMFFNSLPTLLIVISGIVVATLGKTGIYLMVPSIILAFVQVITISWALLIEIHREGSEERWNKDTR